MEYWILDMLSHKNEFPFDITSPWKWKKKARDPGYVSIRYEIDPEESFDTATAS